MTTFLRFENIIKMKTLIYVYETKSQYQLNESFHTIMYTKKISGTNSRVNITLTVFISLVYNLIICLYHSHGLRR